MPRRPLFRTTAVGDLFEGVRFAPPESLRRQMLAAESLLRELDAGTLYPGGFIVYRITGFRSDSEELGEATLPGAALLVDLTTFVERTSERLDLGADERPGGALDTEAAAARLGVTTRSLQRYRAQGLAVHWIRFADGARRVGCYLESLEAFRARRLPDGRPPPRHRTSERERETLLRDAAELAREGKSSLNQAAVELSRRHQRPAQSIRSLLRSAPDLSFAPVPRLGKDDLRVAYRAWRIGVDPERIAAHLARDRAATWRAINRGRREALRGLRLPRAAPLPTFERREAEEVLLAPPAVGGGLPQGLMPADVPAFLRAFPPAAVAGSRSEERGHCHRLVALRFFLWRAAGAVPKLARVPTTATLDLIECDLRRAASLRRALVETCIPAALGRIEAALGGSFAALPAEEQRRWILRAIHVIVTALEGVDAAEAADGRLRVTRLAALSMDRDLAKAPPVTGRAATRGGAALPLGDLIAVISPWTTTTPSHESWIERAASLSRESRAILAERFGWSGSLPRTMQELAEHHRLAPSLMQSRLSRAMTQLRAPERPTS